MEASEHPPDLATVVEADDRASVERNRMLQPFEYLPARQRPFELTHDLFEMVLNNAIQIHQFAVDIVDHLDLSRRSHEVKRGPARENLDVTVVLRKARDDVLHESTLKMVS